MFKRFVPCVIIQVGLGDVVIIGLTCPDFADILPESNNALA